MNSKHPLHLTLRCLTAILMLAFGAISQAQVVVRSLTSVGSGLRADIVVSPDLGGAELIEIVVISTSTLNYTCTGTIRFTRLGTLQAAPEATVQNTATAAAGQRTSIVAARLPRGSSVAHSPNDDTIACTASAANGGSGAANSGTNRTVQLIGNYGYSIDLANRTVRFTADRIQNPSATRTTGTLRLELWATTTPYAGGNISGYRIASYQIAGSSSGTLRPNEYFQGIAVTAPISNWPSDGAYYMTFLVSEYSSTCTSSDRFCLAAYGGFSNRLTVGGNGGSTPSVTRLQIVGSYGVTVDFAAGSVRWMLDRLQNPSATRTTGSLRLELWATSAPYAGGDINGYRIATYQIGGSSNGTLGPNQYFYGIDGTSTVTSRPPAGTYYATIVVSEYSSSCTSSDRYCINTYASLSSPLYVGASVDPGTGLDFGGRTCLKYKKGKCKKWSR